MASIGRNQPCPCGSRKKYKHCCLGKGDPVVRKRQRWLIIGAVLLSIGAGIGVGLQYSNRSGIFTALIGLIAVGAYLILRNPPSSRGRSGADRIDFGR